MKLIFNFSIFHSRKFEIGAAGENKNRNRIMLHKTEIETEKCCTKQKQKQMIFNKTDQYRGKDR